MRVYELAKELNISNKELIQALGDKGFTMPSHMSVIPQEAVAFVEKKFGKTSQATPATTTPEKAVSSRERTGSAPASSQASFIIKPMTVGEFAEQAGKPLSEVILFLLRSGRLFTVNQVLNETILDTLARHFELEIVRPEAQAPDEQQFALKKRGGAAKRLPVVVVIGHVDHGKTTLLDRIRKTRVVSREKGGITQHIGAYKAHTDHGDIVFLDTPGHAAFSQIRARGVRVADIAILVVAADDSVKPQTIEAIKHAKAAEIPLIVAINKVDKAEHAQIERVKQDLAQYDVLPEEWGGQIVCVPISAKVGTGVDQLLEMILLQADIMDLTADIEKPAAGVVLESELEKGRGPVATVLSHQGTLKVGDYFAAGNTTGKINSIVDSFGKRVASAGPSEPVRIAGFKQLPDAGDYFEVVTKDKMHSLRAGKIARPAVPRQLEEDALNFIIKTDTNSTKEALLGALAKLGKKADTSLNIIHSAVGNISESDITLATNTGASIYGLHVKIEPNAAELGRKNLTTIKLFDIIYKLLEDVEERAKKPEKIEMVTKKIGEASVLRVFDIKNIGVIAGCIVKEGRFVHNGSVVVWRGRRKVGEGSIKSLQRERKSVKEVHKGFECGFLIEGLNDFQVDDRVECYLEMPES